VSLAGAGAVDRAGQAGKRQASPAQPAPPFVGGPLPDVTVQDFQSKNVTLASLRGRPTLLTFWASWCGPCVREMPVFQKLADHYSGRLQVVAIAMLEDPGDSRTFIGQHPTYHFVFLHDPDWQTGQSRLATTFGLSGLPTSLLLDAKGIVRDAWQGGREDAELTGRIERLMGK
jgi:thiol-disulfide isomerase/thioredoxin